MGKVNVSLKRSYKIVTSVSAIMSFLLLVFTVFSHGHLYDNEEIVNKTLCVLYFISIITLLLNVLGLYGAIKEKQWVLILFAVGMIIISLFMTACEIPALVFRPQMAEDLKRQYLTMLPLADTSKSFLDDLMVVQKNFQCCGLDQGYWDWGYSISESCLCTKESTKPCVAAPRNSSLFQDVLSDQPIMIYEESCLPYLIERVMTPINAALGVIFGVILLWVVSISLCMVILRHLRRDIEVDIGSAVPDETRFTLVKETSQPQLAQAGTQ